MNKLSQQILRKRQAWEMAAFWLEVGWAGPGKGFHRIQLMYDTDDTEQNSAV